MSLGTSASVVCFSPPPTQPPSPRVQRPQLMLVGASVPVTSTPTKRQPQVGIAVAMAGPPIGGPILGNPPALSAVARTPAAGSTPAPTTWIPAPQGRVGRT